MLTSQRVSEGGDKAFAFKIDRTTTTPGAYPVTLVSYAIACGKYPDAAKADLVRSYLSYVVSPEGQAAAASAAGSAPLPASLTSQITPAVQSITGGA